MIVFIAATLVILSMQILFPKRVVMEITILVAVILAWHTISSHATP